MSDVSFVITTYNYAKYIQECIYSILNQETFDSNQLIIIDDGSEDNTYELIKDLIKKPYIEYINIKNSGIEYASNLAIERVRNKYFVRIDADDSLKLNYLTHIEKIINCNYDFIYSDYTTIDQFSNNLSHKKLPYFDQKEIFSRGDFLATGTLIKKDSFDFVRRYDTSIKNCGLENYSLIIRLIKANFVGKHLPLSLFNYRIHPTNMSKSRKNDIINYGNSLTKNLLNKPYETNPNHPHGLII